MSKVTADIQNLTAGMREGEYVYDFVVIEQSLCKTGTSNEVPQENQGSEDEIKKYLVAKELSELDASHLLLLVTTEE